MLKEFSKTNFFVRLLRFAKRRITGFCDSVRYKIQSLRRRRAIRFLILNATKPQGTAIMRYYWDQYLAANRSRFFGRGLEIDTDTTVRSVGGNRMESVDILNYAEGLNISIVADLCKAWNVPSGQYDVFLVQFTMHVVENDLAALYHSIRVLKSGGSLVCNFPCVGWYPAEGWDYKSYKCNIWRWYTPSGVAQMLEKLVPQDAFHITVFGNRASYVGYVVDADSECITSSVMDRRESGWPVLIGVTIVKPADWAPQYQPSDLAEQAIR